MKFKRNLIPALMLAALLVVSLIPMGTISAQAEDDGPGVCYLKYFMSPDDEEFTGYQTVEIGSAPVKPEDPAVREGMVFVGWYSDKGLTKPFDFSAPMTEDTAVYARVVSSEDCYNVLVYLDPEAPEPVAGFEVPKGDPIPERDDPGREGATFAGWYTDRELTQPADFTAPRDSDVSLFPKFITEEDCYTVWVYLRPDAEEVTTAYDIPKGEPCSMPAEPGREDYEFLGWFTDRELTEPADFTSPRSEDVNLYAGWKLILPDNPFIDVKSDDYFSDPVLWALKKNITTGTDETHFSPEAVCTRGQIVAFLWRAAGSPEPESAVNPFTDVNTDDYYCKAVLWAVKEGITKGTSDTTFGPGQSCTRGQVATFLYRAEGSPDTSLILNPFTDLTSDQYYYDAVLWALMRGITHGTAPRVFSPDDTCTRGQIVTFLFRDMA